MDSYSDVPLSNYAGMDFLRIEIAKLEKLVAEKRPECSRPHRHRQQPGVGRFLESQRRVPCTRRLPKPQCLLWRKETCEFLNGVHRQTKTERGDHHIPTRDDSDKLFQLRASLVGASEQIVWEAG